MFKNNASRPYTMHPHGVFYRKDSEGAGYADGTAAADKKDDAVPPGGTHVYNWGSHSARDRVRTIRARSCGSTIRTPTSRATSRAG